MVPRPEPAHAQLRSVEAEGGLAARLDALGLAGDLELEVGSLERGIDLGVRVGIEAIVAAGRGVELLLDGLPSRRRDPYLPREDHKRLDPGRRYAF